jgi:hypothetical protein
MFLGGEASFQLYQPYKSRSSVRRVDGSLPYKSRSSVRRVGDSIRLQSYAKNNQESTVSMERQWLVPVQARTRHGQKYLWNLRSTALAGGRATRPKATATARGEESSSWYTGCVRHTAKQAKHRCKGAHRSDHQTSKPPTGRSCLTSSGDALSVVISVRRFGRGFGGRGTTAQLMGASPFVPGWPGGHMDGQKNKRWPARARGQFVIDLFFGFRLGISL